MTPVCRFHQVSVPIKTPFFILFGWLVVVEQSSPPSPFLFQKNVQHHQRNITHTHRELPRPLVQGFHTLFSTTLGPPGNPVPCFSFRSSIDEWNERTNERTNNANVFFEGIVCVFKRSCRCISHRPLNNKKNNDFLEMKYHRAANQQYIFIHLYLYI